MANADAALLLGIEETPNKPYDPTSVLPIGCVSAMAKGGFSAGDMPQRAKSHYGYEKKDLVVYVGSLPTLVYREIYDYIEYVWSFPHIQPKNIEQTLMSPLNRLCRVARRSSHGTLLEVSLEEMATKKGRKPSKHVENMMNRLSFSLERTHHPDFLDRDRWEYDEFDLPQVRLNKANRFQRINFLEIEDERDRQLVKRFVLHLLQETNLSVTTIGKELTALRIMCSLLDCRVEAVSRESYVSLRDKLRERYPKPAVFNVMLTRICSFLEWLAENDAIDENPANKRDKVLGRPYAFRETSVSPFVIDQLFEALPGFGERNAMFFLLIYETGMRESEAALMKANAAYEVDGRYYLKYISEKMNDKECTNEIGEFLYRAYATYAKKVAWSNGRWLFPNPSKSSCMAAATLVQQFQRACDEAGIIEENGEHYIFRAHAFRHTFATDLLDSGADFRSVQTMLHHVSPRMTAAYMEVLPRRLAEKNRAKRRMLGLSGHPDEARLDAEEEWLRENMSAQLLPNGICAKPRALGPCEHAYSCLSCPQFVTDVSFLDVHRDHLARLEGHACRCRDMGLWPELETALSQIEALRGIIAGLEEDG